MSREIIFKPMFGLFEKEKLLPLRYCPIQIELELVNDFMDAIVKRDDNKSDLWNISDIPAKCDLLTLGDSLDNEYAAHLLSGTSLPTNFATWSHTNQSTGNDKNLSANIHRAPSRLKSIFATLNSAEGVQYKDANNLFHPTAAKLNDAYDVHDEHGVQVQIGSKTMPECPMTPVTEALYQLRKTVGNPLHMYGRWYRSHRYIIGLDMEYILGAGFTGLSTKRGDQLQLTSRVVVLVIVLIQSLLVCIVF